MNAGQQVSGSSRSDSSPARPARTQEAQTTATITEAEYGDKWPFTVPDGTVNCVGVSSVVCEAGRLMR
jgi:hypothetical protein